MVTIHIQINKLWLRTISALPSHMDSRSTGSTIGTAVSGLCQGEDLEEMLSWAQWQWFGWGRISWNLCIVLPILQKKKRMYKEPIRDYISLMETRQLVQSRFWSFWHFLAAEKDPITGISRASRLHKCSRNDWYEWETNGSYSPKFVAVCPVYLIRPNTSFRCGTPLVAMILSHVGHFLCPEFLMKTRNI